MLTAHESPEFQKLAAKVWTEAERLDFIGWLVQNPDAGDLIVGGEGARKVRWSIAGQGKSGGVRVIYYHLSDDGLLYLLTLYTKAERSTITAKEIKRKKEP